VTELVKEQEQKVVVDQPKGLSVDFLSKVSHDMRSPLSVVSGAFAEIKSDFQDSLSEEHLRLLALAERGVARLLRLADKLSLAARHEKGQVELAQVHSEIGPIVKSAVSTQLGLESRRVVEVSVEVADNVTAAVDPQRLGYALAEIVGNAVRHARSKVLVTCANRGDEVEIAVEDDGEGVPEDLTSRIFQRFGGGTNRGGLGLGLALAKDIVEAHRGRVSVGRSSLPPGRPGTVGAKFVITLPKVARVKNGG
jgi:two-component system, OmpR family, sensor histidine kinase ResE